jgi:DNA-binding NtrC family response regulator
MYKFSILIVDHEESIRLSLSEILRLEGYDVQVASRSEEAVNSLQRQSFDLMIVDLNLPGMGGMELLTRVLELYPNLQGIILSTSATVENVIEALRLRVADYLLKPVSVADIRKSVNRAFRIDSPNPKTLHESRRLYPTIPAPGNEYITKTRQLHI